jgi:hypothetical protein
MNNWQLQNVQDRLRIPGAMAECAGRREINGQLV